MNTIFFEIFLFVMLGIFFFVWGFYWGFVWKEFQIKLGKENENKE